MLAHGIFRHSPTYNSKRLKTLSFHRITSPWSSPPALAKYPFEMYTTIALAGFAILAQTAVGNAIPSGSGALRSMHPRSDGSFAGFYHNTTLGNGVFSVHIDENGEMVHAKLAESSGNSSLPHLKNEAKPTATPTRILPVRWFNVETMPLMLSIWLQPGRTCYLSALPMT